MLKVGKALSADWMRPSRAGEYNEDLAGSSNLLTQFKIRRIAGWECLP